jgi:hypothetical protein
MAKREEKHSSQNYGPNVPTRRVNDCLVSEDARLHFVGSWAMPNCEYMLVIGAWLVRRNLDDSRRIPGLVVWKDETKHTKARSWKLCGQRAV